MIKWDEVQHETESMLEHVQQQMAMYRQRITELESETMKLRGTIAVARRMQEGGYDTPLSLIPQASQAAPTPPAEDDDAGQLELDSPYMHAPALQSKPNWQRGIDALGEIPDLPPAMGLSRQPNKTNTSYRAAALLQMEKREMDIAEIIEAFQQRGWVDSDWARPKDAITIAVKRSVKYGWTRQTGKHAYIYSPQSQEAWQTLEDHYVKEGR
ncbi:hypothetical protein NG701_07670 [Pseudarthrobacter sp. HLT3-5]|uniref:hypothetical protein n=1 Tax=Pseudarthrobacter cellobiosi TaxID=2953654 RepID=UPI00208E34D1|nr:hypothetical protein [Pseudarthrobacter sp. HLT3-5]MCO4274307.1 hypothetical protein [Pseudarthrobacter sp. HLT3-5]